MFLFVMSQWVINDIFWLSFILSSSVDFFKCVVIIKFVEKWRDWCILLKRRYIFTDGLMFAIILKHYFTNDDHKRSIAFQLFEEMLGYL